MLTIDSSDCWLEIGVGKKFTRSLVWHFSRFLRQNLANKCEPISIQAEAIDREARRLATQFIADMQEYFRKTLSDTYEDLDNLSSEGIVELYLQENLDDFEADYLRNHLSGFSSVCNRLLAVVAPIDRPTVVVVETCH